MINTLSSEESFWNILRVSCRHRVHQTWPAGQMCTCGAAGLLCRGLQPQWQLPARSFAPPFLRLRPAVLVSIAHRTETGTCFLLCWNSSWHRIKNGEALQLELCPCKANLSFSQSDCELSTSEHQIILVLPIAERCCRRQSRAGCGPASRTVILMGRYLWRDGTDCCCHSRPKWDPLVSLPGRAN